MRAGQIARFPLSVFLPFAFLTSALAGTINVPGDFPTIQEAINVARDGDCILVGPGTYVENIDFLGKAITLESTDGTEVTTIDGNQNGTSVVTFQNQEGPESVLAGFTITNGEVVGRNGGGILCVEASPTLIHNTILRNHAVGPFPAGDGGGISSSGSPTVIACEFVGNTAVRGGGGICGPATIIGCIFRENSAIGGGGVCQPDNSLLSNCIFMGNSATIGGGLFSFSDACPMIVNCIFSRNVAADRGGGMHFGTGGHPTVTNCTFGGNSATSAGAISLEKNSSVCVVNSILWGDAPNEIGLDQTSQARVNFSDVQGGWAGERNIQLDPRFVDADVGDLHLGIDSPCINMGDNNTADLPRTDFEGDLRVICQLVDIGADEAPEPPGGCRPFLFRSDVDGNGTRNALVDTLFLLEFAFFLGPEPPCLDNADVDDDGVVNPIVDARYLLSFGFEGGPAPLPPFPNCGSDPTPDMLECEPSCP